MTVTVNPTVVCATGPGNPYLNFDLVVFNRSTADLTIAAVEASSRDRTGNLLEQKVLWQDALKLLGEQRQIRAGRRGLLFNPFAFSTAGRADHIDYVITFDGNRTAMATVRPQPCRHEVRLRSPLAGRILVYDGYDFLSHHRRMTWHDRDDLREFGVVDNVYRFGIDLFLIDAAGNLYRGQGNRIEDWFSWSAPVRAAGNGVVTAVRDNMPDNTLGSEDYPRKQLREDEMNPDGNYILIDHGNGEVSTFAHLKYGSARVKVGERVEADQLIALVGNSGSTAVPHLHYELRSSFGVRGVRSAPPYFEEIRLLGQDGGSDPVAINTGDVYIAE